MCFGVSWRVFAGVAMAQRRTEEAHANKAEQMRIRRGNEVLQDHLVSMLPLIQEANMISEELDKACHFELKIVACDAIQGHMRMKRSMLTEEGDQTTIAVRVSEGAKSRMWSRDKFHDRIFAMRDYYQSAMLNMSRAPGEEASEEEMKDPFQDDQEGVLLGHTHIYLESLWWLFPIELNSPVIDYKGKSEGRLKVRIRIVDAHGGDLCSEDGAPGENVNQFLGKDAVLRVEIHEAQGLAAHLQDYYVQYMDLVDTQVHTTAKSENKTATRRFDYIKETKIQINKDFEDQLMSEALSFQVWGYVAKVQPTARRQSVEQRSDFSEREQELQEREERLAARQNAWEKEWLRPMTGAGLYIYIYTYI